MLKSTLSFPVRVGSADAPEILPALPSPRVERWPGGDALLYDLGGREVRVERQAAIRRIVGLDLDEEADLLVAAVVAEAMQQLGVQVRGRVFGLSAPLREEAGVKYAAHLIEYPALTVATRGGE